MTMQRVFVSGKVQRTGYRDWAVRRAQELGITGWVRNLSDGRVELLLVGEDDAIVAMTDACREGSEHSRVEHVEAHAATERAPKGFTKRFTA
ncbi:acylphosphatase [Sphingomonas sp. PAMC 26605]|uniref:acylphosphatase n=1 Tax=Sphingomonas sp. PAMC 26605 TaxID=1112214 RepID=UPI00026CD768|nr:acylphosphatase [Sphingomonas sp. PAMC 26605]